MSALELFSTLPLRERLFVRGRLFTAPLAEVARRAPTEGRIADLGCGHGVLSALLVWNHPRRRVWGFDPDSRKIRWASASVGAHSSARFEVGTSASLAAGSFEAVVVADVLYLLPLSGWPEFLADCRRALVPGGRLLLKETEDDGSWKALKCLAQEQLMVRVLRRTVSSGAIHLAARQVTQRVLEGAGFEVRQTTTLAQGYSSPHVLFEAQAR